MTRTVSNIASNSRIADNQLCQMECQQSFKSQKKWKEGIFKMKKLLFFTVSISLSITMFAQQQTFTIQVLHENSLITLNCKVLTEPSTTDGVTTNGTCEITGVANNAAINNQFTIPETATNDSKTYDIVSIGDNAFENKNFDKIIIPSKLTSIGKEAFKGCSTLKKMTTPNSETSEEIIIIPNSVISIGEGAFSGCNGMTKVIIGSSVSTIGNSTFQNTNLQNITIPNNITSIGDDAFSGCQNLTSVTIEATNPPALGTNSFNGINSNANFTVANESYLYNDNWSAVLNNNNSTTTHVTIASNTRDNLGLIAGKWNFVAGLNNQASIYNSNKPQSYAPTFTDNVDENINDVNNVNNPHCDIAVVGLDYTTNNWSSSYLHANDNMTLGEGYLVYAYTSNYKNTEVTTKGIMTDVNMEGKYKTSGPVSLPTHTNNGNWFAFGNPFDKNLSVTTVLSENVLNNVQGNAVYVLNRDTESWQTLASGDILIGQGFMVKATDNNSITGQLSYPTTAKSTVAQNNLDLKINCLANNITTTAYATQTENASDGFDVNDAYALFGFNENLVEPYFVVEGREIVLNRYNSDNYTCDINFHAQKEGTATLKVSDVPQGTTVSIVDVLTGEETVLDENTSFTFDVEQGENADKYKVKITKGALSIADAEQVSDVNIWNNKGNIYVSGKDLKTVEVLNTLGQSVYMKQIGGNEYNFNLNVEGSYIVRVKSQLGVKSQKVIITK